MWSGPGFDPGTNIICNICLPLFNLIKLTKFSDENFVVRWTKQVKALIAEIKQDLKIMVDWLKGSGLKVNYTSFTDITLAG